MLQLYSTSPTPLYQEPGGKGRASHVIEEFEMPVEGQVYRICFFNVGNCKVTAPTLCQKAGVG